MIDLVIDFFQHFRGKPDPLISAFEAVFSVQIGMLVENHLIHIEFIQVSIQQRNDNRFQFHINFPLYSFLLSEAGSFQVVPGFQHKFSEILILPPKGTVGIALPAFPVVLQKIISHLGRRDLDGLGQIEF